MPTGIQMKWNENENETEAEAEIEAIIHLYSSIVRVLCSRLCLCLCLWLGFLSVRMSYIVQLFKAFIKSLNQSYWIFI